MSQVPPEGRQRARRLAFRSGAAAASFGVAASVAAATGAAIAGPFGLAAALAGAYAWAANEFANDPADPDYDHRAVVRSVTLTVSHAPPDPASGDLARLSVSLSESTGWIRATLRSFERTQGAAQAGNVGVASERLTETRQLARGAAPRVEDSARRFESTARTFQRLGPDLPWAHEVVTVQPLTAELLGYEVLGFIYLAGFPLTDFERAAQATTRRGDMPAQVSATQACIDSADASRSFAQFLREWEPDLAELRATLG